MYRIGGTSDRLWNIPGLIKYLATHQGDTIDLKIEPEAVCLHNLGLYDILDSFSFKQVNIHTNNPLEKHHRYNIILQENYSWFNKTPPINSTFYSWNQKKIFYCLFGRPTAGRLGLATHLLEHHAGLSLIHFSAVTNDDNLEQFELNKLLTYRLQSIQEVGKLIDKLPLLLSDPDRYTAFNGYDYSDPLTAFYQDILIDLVVESHVAGKTFYATEKTVRPMLLKKPFMVFASRNYLDYLHQMGFKTFCEFWNENYDGFEGRDRFCMMLDLIDSLASKPRNDLIAMYHAMQPVLEHNYNLLINKNFSTTIQEIS